MRRIAPWAIAPLAALTLNACNRADNSAAAEPTDATLTATLAGDDQFNTLDEVITNAGLDTVLDGVGPYTVIAPTDDAFAASASNQIDFTADALRAQGAQLVRSHLLPGFVTREDLLAAIETGGEAGAEMRTMADGVLTFTRDGGAIVVTAEDGSSARLTGEEALTSNGVIQPVDQLLLAAPEGTAGE